METARTTDIHLGIRIEVISIIWMIIEMTVSIGMGIAAGSILLIAFGIDSLIELISGGILLWRLRVESRGEDIDQVEQAEHRAAWIVAVTLGMLCAYVFVSAVYGLVVHAKPENTVLGIGISAAAVLIGLALNALFGWWWIEDIAALLFLVWLVRETWEAFEEARSE